MPSAEESGEGDSCLFLGLRTEIPNVSSVRRRSGTRLGLVGARGRRWGLEPALPLGSDAQSL